MGCLLVSISWWRKLLKIMLKLPLLILLLVVILHHSREVIGANHHTDHPRSEVSEAKESNSEEAEENAMVTSSGNWVILVVSRL